MNIYIFIYRYIFIYVFIYIYEILFVRKSFCAIKAKNCINNG